MLAPKVNNKGSGSKKLAPAVAAALITGASALGSTGISAWNTSSVNRSNQRSVDRQNQYAVQLRDYDNWYNSPAQQMKRFRDAGLNPDLIYGSMEGSSSSAPSLTSPSTDVGFDASALATSGSEIANLLNNKSLVNAQTNLIKAQSDNMEIKNKLDEKDLSNKDKRIFLENQQLEANIENSRAQYQQTLEQTRGIKISNDFNADSFSKRLDMLDEQLKGLKIDNDIKGENLKVAQNAVKLSALQLIKARLENALLDQSLKQNSVMFELGLKKVNAEINKINQDTKAVEISNAFSQRDFNIKVAKDGVYDAFGKVKDNGVSVGLSYANKVFDYVGSAVGSLGQVVSGIFK